MFSDLEKYIKKKLLERSTTIDTLHEYDCVRKYFESLSEYSKKSLLLGDTDIEEFILKDPYTALEILASRKDFN